MGKLTGKVAVITGGITDVSLAIAEKLRAEDVAGIAILTPEAAQVEGASTYVCDIGSYDAVEAAFAAIASSLGEVDILINNPDAHCHKTLLETSPEEWNRVLSINTHSLFYCCKQVFPQMKARRTGKVINITSAALYGTKADAAYAVSKATVLGFHGAISRETERYTTTCHTVTPALNATPQEVAGTVAFLASEDGRCFHGQNVTVTHSFLEV